MRVRARIRPNSRWQLVFDCRGYDRPAMHATGRAPDEEIAARVLTNGSTDQVANGERPRRVGYWRKFPTDPIPLFPPDARLTGAFTELDRLAVHRGVEHFHAVDISRRNVPHDLGERPAVEPENERLGHFDPAPDLDANERV